MAKLNVPSASEIAKKWAEEGPKRATYYEKNTPGAASRWQTNAAGASSNYKAAIGATDIDKRFAGGIKRAGSAKFERKVKDVGVSRFGPGITAAEKDMESGVGLTVDTLKAVDVPDRKPRGDPANYKRVDVIGSALNKARLAKLAAG